jgi:hypothetical protein
MRPYISKGGDAVEINFGGDAELETLADGLRWAADVLDASKIDGTNVGGVKVLRRLME